MQIENKLNEINISINKAVIRKVTFELDDDKLPEISITMDLLSVGGNKVTSVTLDSRSYYGECTKIDKVQLDPKIWAHLREQINILAPMCIRKINSIDRLLTI